MSFRVKVSYTTSWEKPQWEEVDQEFGSFEEANDWGENWRNNQMPVEFSDGFHNVGVFKVERVNENVL